MTQDQQQRVQFLNESHISEIIQLIPSLFISDNNVRLQAEKKLNALSLSNYFMYCLMKIVDNEHVSEDIRRFCCISFKNTLDRHWRKEASYPIIQDEKDKIYKEIISLTIRIRNESVFSLMALNIAKIARIDFPTPWENIFQEIHHFTNVQDEEVRLKAIMIMNEVIKQLSTKKLLDSKAAFRKITAELSGFICQVWKFYIDSIYQKLESYIQSAMHILSKSNAQSLDQAPQDAQVALASLSQATYHQVRSIFKGMEHAVSILGNFIDHGMTNLEDWSHVFFKDLLVHLKKFYSFFDECRRRKIRNAVTGCVVHAIRRLARPILYAVIRHAVSFSSHYEDTIPFFLSVVTNCGPEDESKGFVEKEYNYLLITFLTVLKLTLDSPTYSRVYVPNPTPEVEKIQNLIFDKVLSVDVLGNLIMILITRYMTLTMEELELWDTDPEEFLKDQDSDSDGTLKGSAETLFMSILDSNEEICQKFASLLEHLISMTDDNRDNKEKVLIREAAFSALGWGSYYLYDHIDFNKLFNSKLYKEVLDPATNKYIVRRLIWVLGRWTEKMDSQMRVQIYKTFHNFISQMRDEEVLYLTIFYTLSDMADDYYFQYSEIEPFLPSFIENIFKICDVSFFEASKLRLLRFLSTLVSHSQDTQFAANVLFQLKKMWESNSAFLIQTSIVNLLNEFAQSPLSNTLFDGGNLQFVIRIIVSGINPEMPGHIYFYEEALELYKSILNLTEKDESVAPLLNNALLPISHFIFEALQRSSEYIILSVQVLEQHINIGAEEFLSHYSNQLASFICSTIGNFKAQTILHVTNIIQAIFNYFPSEGPQMLYASVCKILISLLAEDEEESLLVQYAVILCQVLLFNKDLFLKALQDVSQAKNRDSQELFSTFMARISKFGEQEWSVYYRRLIVMAAFSCLPGSDARLLQHIPPLLHIAAQFEGETLPPSFPAAFHESPVTQANFIALSSNLLHEIQSTYGVELYNQTLSQCPPNVISWIGIA